MVLCGGRGKRLNPVTENIPKALVPIRGQAIVDHVIERYKKSGIKKITYCIGYKGNLIRDHFSGQGEGSYQFCDSGEQASMLRRIYDAAKMVEMPRFIVAYCDTFIDYSSRSLIAHHEKLGVSATIVTTSVINPFGIIQVNDREHVQSFIEKPVQTYFIGTFIMERKAMDLVEPEMLDMPDGEGLVSFFQKLIRLELLGAHRHDGMQITFNTEEERARAETELHRFYTLGEGNGV